MTGEENALGVSKDIGGRPRSDDTGEDVFNESVFYPRSPYFPFPGSPLLFPMAAGR